jgi:hypothetical protein
MDGHKTRDHRIRTVTRCKVRDCVLELWPTGVFVAKLAALLRLLHTICSVWGLINTFDWKSQVVGQTSTNPHRQDFRIN